MPADRVAFKQQRCRQIDKVGNPIDRGIDTSPGWANAATASCPRLTSSEVSFSQHRAP
jgi:hypothetical protein